VGEHRSREGCKVRGKFFVPTICFTPFSFMCKTLVDEEIFLKGKVLTEESRRGRGVFLKVTEQKLPVFIPYVPLSAANV
jgi:hypothetical protein